MNANSRSDLGLPDPPPGKTGWPWFPEIGPAGRDVPTPCGGWPRISVVVTSFDQAPFLEEALRSLLLQGYPDLETIVVDGGSRDGSFEILERYGDSLSYWQSASDGGQSSAINLGFARATGDLVTFFSSDDAYLPGALADAARRFRDAGNAGEPGAVVGAFQFMDALSQPASETIPPRLLRSPIDLALADPASWRLHQVAAFYGRHALDAVGRRVVEELRYTMDRELLYRVCRRFPIALSNQAYARFRKHASSKSIAEVLPFSAEMATLHLTSGVRAGEPANVMRTRRRWSRHWRARGHLKAAAVRGGAAACGHLLRALRFQPRLLWQRSYAVRWLEAFGVAGRLRARWRRRARRDSPGAEPAAPQVPFGPPGGRR